MPTRISVAKSGGGAQKASFEPFVVYKMIILPGQAWDKHNWGKLSLKRGAFLRSEFAYAKVYQGQFVDPNCTVDTRYPARKCVFCPILYYT